MKRIATVIAAMAVLATTAAAQKAVKAPAYKDTDSLIKSLPSVTLPALDPTHASWLSAMSLSCLDHPQARPANPGYVWQPTYAPVANFDKSRSFYGCFDWHSAA